MFGAKLHHLVAPGEQAPRHNALRPSGA